ncbi:MAG: Tm-1-like ATP-binding domain-containing protein, partial [Planctomycetes bacterium]|nr:Tm-1-like ATP-binding domain-containing protein [Planctomycetota bacterium]
MPRTVAILAPLDTKGPEAAFLKEQIEAQGGRALLIDMGLVGEPGTSPDFDRQAVCQAGGTPLEKLLKEPAPQQSAPVIIAGATAILKEQLEAGAAHAVLGIGGTQGSANIATVMRELPFGFPKVLVSTMASGDVSNYVGMKDITMMFPISDILGLNPVTRKILANAAASAFGMAQVELELEPHSGDRPVIGISNLGVITKGTFRALQRFQSAGYECIVFHAVGSGGLAMEQLMRDGHIGAVFDYGLGEIADEVHGGFRAADATRLTTAGALQLPQVLAPCGTEHIGLFVEPDEVPEAWSDHQWFHHNPIVFVPRLNASEMEAVAKSICERLQSTEGRATMFLPLHGTSRYGVEGGALRDPESDAAFFQTLRDHMPAGVEVVDVEAGAEDSDFVDRAVDR